MSEEDVLGVIKREYEAKESDEVSVFEAESVNVLHNGSGKRMDWVMVETGRGKGYVPKEYVKVIGEESAFPPSSITKPSPSKAPLTAAEAIAAKFASIQNSEQPLLKSTPSKAPLTAADAIAAKFASIQNSDQPLLKSTPSKAPLTAAEAIAAKFASTQNSDQPLLKSTPSKAPLTAADAIATKFASSTPSESISLNPVTPTQNSLPLEPSSVSRKSAVALSVEKLLANSSSPTNARTPITPPAGMRREGSTSKTVASLVAARQQQAAATLRPSPSHAVTNVANVHTPVNTNKPSMWKSPAELAAELANKRLNQPNSPRNESADKRLASILSGRQPLQMSPTSSSGRPDLSYYNRIESGNYHVTPLAPATMSGEEWMVAASSNLKRSLFNVLDHKEVSGVMKQNDEWFSQMMSAQRESFQDLVETVDATEKKILSAVSASDALISKLASYTKLKSKH